MTKGLKLLKFLNPDVAETCTLAGYIYGADNPVNRRKILQLIAQLRRLGWKIERRRFGLNEDQYALIQSKGDFTEMPWGQALTEDNVRNLPDLPGSQSVKP